MDETLAIFTPQNYKESELGNKDSILNPVIIHNNSDAFNEPHEAWRQRHLDEMKESSKTWLRTVSGKDKDGNCYVRALANLMNETGISSILADEEKIYGNPAAVHIYNDGMVISSWFEGKERNIMIKGKPTYIDKNICECEGCHG